MDVTVIDTTLVPPHSGQGVAEWRLGSLFSDTLMAPFF